MTSIGSLPHTDASAAAAFVLDHLPDLPAAPSLPRRSLNESMLGQVASGLPGVAVRSPGRLAVDLERLADAEVPAVADLGGDAYVGLRAFLSAIGGRRGAVKVQVTGPVTLGIALSEAGTPSDIAFEVAGMAVRAHARAVVDAVGAVAPEAPVVAFLDEPGLAAWGTDAIPLSADDVIDLVSGSLAAIEPRAVCGVHCCGPTDWRLPIGAGARVLSLPADDHAVAAADVLAGYLDRGGWVAWGAVPTSGPVGDDTDLLWRQLTDVWCRLVQEGCDPALLRTQALLSPSCGLAGHGVSQASRALRLAAELARRAQDQAMAARLSVGA